MVITKYWRDSLFGFHANIFLLLHRYQQDNYIPVNDTCMRKENKVYNFFNIWCLPEEEEEFYDELFELVILTHFVINFLFLYFILFSAQDSIYT